MTDVLYFIIMLLSSTIGVCKISTDNDLSDITKDLSLLSVRLNNQENILYGNGVSGLIPVNNFLTPKVIDIVIFVSQIIDCDSCLCVTSNSEISNNKLQVFDMWRREYGVDLEIMKNGVLIKSTGFNPAAVFDCSVLSEESDRFICEMAIVLSTLNAFGDSCIKNLLFIDRINKLLSTVEGDFFSVNDNMLFIRGQKEIFAPSSIRLDFYS